MSENQDFVSKENGPAEPPLAFVQGQPFTDQPRDLYIPSQALRINLPLFEGPLDLLLYLIRRNHFNILDLPVAEVTQQYMQYIEMMESIQFEVAAEYLVMASTLVEIKSRMLLPRPPSCDEDGESEEDARSELVRKLIEYQRFKDAAINLDELPRQERDFAPLRVFIGNPKSPRPEPDVKLQALFDAMLEVLYVASLRKPHQIVRETLSVSDRITVILDLLGDNQLLSFYDCLTPREGRLGLVLSLIHI